MPVAAYDDVADWYEAWATGEAAPVMGRTSDLLRATLGAGDGVCWDLVCGTGVHAAAVTALGWRLAGSDVSTGQLRHAGGRLPVVAADARALPLADASVDAVVSVLCHTDVPDYLVACREAARVLHPGGRFAHVGLHPCFVGGHVDRSEPHHWVVTDGYPYHEDSPPGERTWTGRHVQARVGAFPVSLTHLVTAVLDAGMVVEAVRESGDGPAPDLLAIRARTPQPVQG